MKKTHKHTIILIVVFLAVIAGAFGIKSAIARRMDKAQATTQFFNNSISALLDGFKENADEAYCVYYENDKGFLRYDVKQSQVISTQKSENFDETITHLELYDEIVSFVDGHDCYFLISELEQPHANIDTTSFSNLRFFEFKAAVRKNNQETVLDGEFELITCDQGTALIIRRNNKTYVLTNNAFANFNWQTLQV